VVGWRQVHGLRRRQVQALTPAQAAPLLLLLELWEGGRQWAGFRQLQEQEQEQQQWLPLQGLCY
jgi:hypothetical protein